MHMDNTQLEDGVVNIADYLDLAHCYLALDEFDNAKEFFDRASKMDPDNPEPYIGTGLIAMAQNDNESAMAALVLSVKLDQNNSKAHASLASLYQKLGEFEDSFAYYLKSLELDCDNMAALLGLFQVSAQMGSFSKVIHYLEQYLMKHPDDLSVLFCLSNLYVKEGKLELAKDILLELVSLDNDYKDAIELLEEVENMIAQNRIKVA